MIGATAAQLNLDTSMTASIAELSGKHLEVQETLATIPTDEAKDFFLVTGIVLTDKNIQMIRLYPHEKINQFNTALFGPREEGGPDFFSELDQSMFTHFEENLIPNNRIPENIYLEDPLKHGFGSVICGTERTQTAWKTKQARKIMRYPEYDLEQSATAFGLEVGKLALARGIVAMMNEGERAEELDSLMLDAFRLHSRMPYEITSEGEEAEIRILDPELDTEEYQALTAQKFTEVRHHITNTLTKTLNRYFAVIKAMQVGGIENYGSRSLYLFPDPKDASASRRFVNTVATRIVIQMNNLAGTNQAPTDFQFDSLLTNSGVVLPLN